MDKSIFLKKFFLFRVVIVILLILTSFLINRIVINRNHLPWIKIASKKFIKDGEPFHFIGASAVNLVFYDDWGLDIEKAVQSAKENNISVLRLYMDWGWSKDEDFDRILDIASRYGIYIILTLTDCCCSGDYSSLKKYFEVHAPFCNITNKQSVAAFKKRIKQIIERKNSINGKIYRDDSTIIAWEIANELEYQHFSYTDVRKWIDELATYIKSLDKNHLVTIGIGTYSSDFDRETPLYEMFNVSGLDFFSFHFYPSTEVLNSDGMILSKDFIHQIEFRTKRFLSMGKPVIMGEFGFSNSVDLNSRIKSHHDTVELYTQVFEKSMDAAFTAGASGVMFWAWGVPEEKGVPMWWRQESHSRVDEALCVLLRNYKIPKGH